MSAPRVLLLARAGTARDNTEQALKAAGAELEAVLDPLTASENELRAVQASAVMVVLDAQVEAALEPFDAFLDEPSRIVLYEEAELAAKRDGWEAARWARHLAAKLAGHSDVLPPRPFGDQSGIKEEIETLVVAMAQLPPEVPAITEDKGDTLAAVVIVGGVGGPDAVRQVLADLPEEFPLPILLRQPLGGGHYDRLIRQMQRATTLRIELAQADEVPQRGVVYVLPDKVDLGSNQAKAAFVSCEGEPRFPALYAANSAMLLLSGAELALVDVALAVRLRGGLVFGQSAENCFDPAASQALVARGGEARSLAVMAHQLRERWPN